MIRIVSPQTTGSSWRHGALVIHRSAPDHMLNWRRILGKRTAIITALSMIMAARPWRLSQQRLVLPAALVLCFATAASEVFRPRERLRAAMGCCAAYARKAPKR